MRLTGIGRWARWGLLATTAAMAIALVATAWIGARQVADAASTLNRGQGELLLEATRQFLRDASPPYELDSLLKRQEAAGLTYAALYDTASVLLARAGEPSPRGPATLPITRPSGPRGPEMVSLGDRIRIIAVVPLGRGGRREAAPPGAAAGAPRETAPGSTRREPPRDRDPDAPGGGGGGGGARDAFRTRPPPPLALIEFQPTVADQLAAQATRTVVLSAIVAIALLGAAVMFWRLSLQHEQAERHLEQQKRLGVLGEMSAVLAHEIRNPLASLKGNAQLLAERLPPAGAERKKADRIVTEAQRLETLVTDLLDFARSGPIDIRAQDPVAVLRASVDDVDPHGFIMHVDGAPSAWPLDAPRMRQALTNVLRNALQASGGARRPEAAIARENGSLVFTIRDFGTGIPAGDEERIFSPFYTTRTTGTGLGLAVAQRVAEMHQGSITARNVSDGGAEFRLTIPGR
jgi:two-component system sensor histidine kinase HydH